MRGEKVKLRRRLESLQRAAAAGNAEADGGGFCRSMVEHRSSRVAAQPAERDAVFGEDGSGSDAFHRVFG